MMYENMVRELRNAADEWRANHLSVSTFETRYDLALLDAADAIEELIKPQNTVHLCASCEKYQNKFPVCMPDKGIVFGCGKGNDNICQCPKYVAIAPRWIPVTERLPECDLGAEVGNIEWISSGIVRAGCFGRGGKYRDAYFRTWTDATEGMDAKDADYWRVVTLPELPKEET